MNSSKWLQINTIVNYASHDATVAALDKFIAQCEEEQRQWCFDRVKKVAIGMYFSSARMSDNEILSDFEDACLNATGEKE